MSVWFDMAYRLATEKIAEDLHFSEYDGGVVASGVPGKWNGPKWRNTAPLPSSEGYTVNVLRNGVDGALDDNELELENRLHDYGRYLESMHRSNHTTKGLKLRYPEAGTPEHIREVGGGSYGNDFMYRDPLPSDRYAVALRRLGKVRGGMTPTELEYAEKLKDHLDYLQFAHNVTSSANRQWEDALENRYINTEVEHKG